MKIDLMLEKERNSRKIRMDLFNEDCFSLLKRLENNSISVLLTDPPYSLLKNHKIEAGWNIKTDLPRFAREIKRVMKKDGWVIFFGLQPSITLWNAEFMKYFDFRSEVIWYKGKASNPLNTMLKYYENISIFSCGKVNFAKNIYLDYFQQQEICQEMTGNSHCYINSLRKAVDTLVNVSKFPNKIKELEILIEKGFVEYALRNDNKITEGVIQKQFLLKEHGQIGYLKTILNGRKSPNIICFRPTNNSKEAKQQHPTAKPIKLIEYLLKLVIKTGNEVVLDPFCGSGSTAVACKIMNLEFLGSEIVEKYYTASLKRIKEYKIQENLL